MYKDILIAFRVTFLTLLVMGFIYPFLVTGFSYLLFHRQAGGSLLMDEQKQLIGSELIGQNFKNPAYFFPRPSAAGQGYDGTASGGSNLAQTSKELLKTIQTRIEAINHPRRPDRTVDPKQNEVDPWVVKASSFLLQT